MSSWIKNKGSLKALGYAPRESAEKRHAALHAAIAEYGKTKVMQKLVAISNLSVNKPNYAYVHQVYLDDIAWLKSLKTEQEGGSLSDLCHRLTPTGASCVAGKVNDSSVILIDTRKPEPHTPGPQWAVSLLNLNLNPAASLSGPQSVQHELDRLTTWYKHEKKLGEIDEKGHTVVRNIIRIYREQLKGFDHQVKQTGGTLDQTNESDTDEPQAGNGIDPQAGEGLYEWWKSITGKEPGQKRVSKLLEAHGRATLKSITVYREPVKSTLTNLLNAISLGTFSQGQKDQGYDKFFHLFAIISLSDGFTFKIEKNQSINIVDNPPTPSIAPGGGQMSIPNVASQNIPLVTFIESAVRQEGNDFYRYDAFGANCQKFILGLLSASGLADGESKSFILQNVQAIAANMPGYVRPGAKALTDIAGVLTGGGYDPDQPPPMIPVPLNTKLQEEASKLPLCNPGESLVNYAMRTGLRGKDAILGYSAMLNRTSFQDPGTPDPAMRTPAEVAADNAREIRVKNAWNNTMDTAVAQQVTSGALNYIHQGSKVIGAIASKIPGGEDIGAAANTLSNNTGTIGNLLGIPPASELTDSAVAARVASAVEKAMKGGGLQIGGNYPTPGVDYILPPINILQMRASGVQLVALATALFNASSNHYNLNYTGSQAEKDEWAQRMKTYIPYLTGVPPADPINSVDSLLPSVDLLKSLFAGPQLTSIMQCLLKQELLSLPYQEYPLDPYPYLDALKHRIQHYQTILGTKS